MTHSNASTPTAITRTSTSTPTDTTSDVTSTDSDTSTHPRRPFPPVGGVEVRHRFVQARGLRFHVAEAGAGEPVLLLHTFPQHWYAWRDVMARLAGEYRLLALDFRGAGWSDAPAGGYDTASRVADVLAVLDALELPRVRLAAHGWGAWAGFFACLQAPERFSHHLALNMIHPWPNHRAVMLSAWRYWHTALWEWPGIGRRVLRHGPGVTRRLLRHWAADPSAWQESDLARYAEVSREPPRARAGEALNWQYVRHDIPGLVLRRDRDRRLATPTLLLAGRSDPVVTPAMLRGGQRHADDLTVQVVPGGHLLPEERPDLVAAAALELFAR